MSTTNKRRQAQRRDFLKGMAVAGGGVAVVATTGTALADASRPELEGPVDDAGSDLGYQETAHVRQYYDKARF